MGKKQKRKELEEDLMKAAIEGDPSEIHRLAKAGANVNAALMGIWTPLMLAAQYGRDEAATELLRAGADIDAKCPRHGWTPLMYAARRGQDAVAKMLVEAGADWEAKDLSGRSAEDLVRKYVDPEVAETLRGRRAIAEEARALSEASPEAKPRTKKGLGL